MNKLVAAAILVTSSVAAAQPDADEPVTPSPYEPRAGTPMVGVSLGLGSITADNNPANTMCVHCDYSPTGAEVDGHVGGMVTDRFALMLELQGNGQQIDDPFHGSTTLTQMSVMLAAQYWVTPKVWLKAGLGASRLAYRYDDARGLSRMPIDDGGAMMVAVGYEVLHARAFAIDLQGRLIGAGYDGIGERISSATIGLGVSWYGFGITRGVIVLP